MPATLSAAVLCLVVGIQDGDTLTARCPDAAGAATAVRVRLAEIDAPERGQPWGTSARESLSELCFGKQASLSETGRDRYGRAVARVTCQGEDASVYQAKRGMAWAYLKYLTDKSVLDATESARTERVGLWADQAPVPPWEWRRMK